MNKTGAQSTQRPRDPAIIPAIICLALLTLLAFAPSLAHGFINWDDDRILVNNPLILSLDPRHLLQIFSSTVQTVYCPLTLLSFAIEHQFFGFNPFVYHLDNLLLHLGVVVAIFFLALRLQFSAVAAFLASAVFAIHPLHVESVAWVTERKDVLYALFYVLAMRQYLDYCGNGRRGNFVLSVVFGILSMLAKPMAASLPLVLFLLDWFLQRPYDKKTILEKIPHFLFIVPLAAITFFQNVHPPVMNPAEAPLIWIWTFSFYLKKFLWPALLLPIYALPEPVSIYNPQYLLAIGIFLFFIYSLCRWRKNRLWLFAGGYYVLSIFLLLRSYDITKTMGPNLVADRFMYLPCLGFCLFVGYEADRILASVREKAPRLRSWAFAFVVLILGGLAGKTFTQSRMWGDEFNLWTYTIQHSPSVMAYDNLGRVYLERKDFPRAIAMYNKALGYRSVYDFWIYNELGILSMNLGKFEEGIAYYSKSISLKPDYPEALINRASLYYQIGKYDEAFDDYTKTIQVSPIFAEAFHNRAIIFFRRAQFPSAVADLTRAIEIKPNYPSAYYLRAQIYAMIGEGAHAIRDFDQVLKTNPGHAGTLARREMLIKGSYGSGPRVLDLF